MKKIVLAFLFTCSFAIPTLAGSTPFFLRQPALTPDGDRVYFVHADALWCVGTQGGTATPVVTLPGRCSTPRVSPDGQWLAFVSTADGNPNVYAMPTQGGAIRQLTFTDGQKEVDSWGWDNETIYFTSRTFNLFSAFRTSRRGGTPTPALGDGFYSHTHGAVEAPNGKGLYFGTSWESARFATRKGYRGANAPAIEFLNAKNDSVTRLTDGKSQALWPITDKQGTLYFVSDANSRAFNLYSLQNGTPRQLTHFEHSIYTPTIAANGGKIAFVKDYQLYIYDVATATPSLCPVTLPDLSTIAIPVARNVRGEISDFDLSTDGEKIAFVSRGRIFISSASGDRVRELPTPSQERAEEVRWLADSKTVVYSRTEKGWANLFTQPANGSGKETRLTNANERQYNLSLSPSREQLVFHSGNNSLQLLNTKTWQGKEIAHDGFWYFSDAASFSHDGLRLMYTAYRNFEPDIFVYDIPTGKTQRITTNGTAENSPVWNADGTALYLSANRSVPRFPKGIMQSELYRLPLIKRGPSLSHQEDFNTLFNAAAPDGKEQKALPPAFAFDPNRVDDRWEHVPTPAAVVNSLQSLLFRDSLRVLFCYSYELNDSYIGYIKEDKFGNVYFRRLGDGYLNRAVAEKNGTLALINGSLFNVDFDHDALHPVALNHTFTTSASDEFHQMFYETWAIIQQTFYDSTFHGTDWEAVKRYYERFIPYVRSRNELATIQTDMLGELNASHLGFETYGRESDSYYSQKAYTIGVDFLKSDPLKVKSVVYGGPLDRTNSRIKAGVTLVAVNGVRIPRNANRDSLFYGASVPPELTLTFKDAKGEFDEVCSPISYEELRQLRYEHWASRRREIVDSASKGTIGYVHMYDMGETSLERFLQEMTSVCLNKEGLIVDLRHNRGGNVHDDVLSFLAQRPYMLWKSRGGRMASQPNFSPSGKAIVMIIDRESLSDAEVTSSSFKELKLGTLMGTETYRWIIFTGSFGLVDGSSTRIPTWGCYDMQGRDLERTGVTPDIYVPMDANDYYHDNDTQLQAAIKYLLKKGK